MREGENISKRNSALVGVYVKRGEEGGGGGILHWLQSIEVQLTGPLQATVVKVALSIGKRYGCICRPASSHGMQVRIIQKTCETLVDELWPCIAHAASKSIA